MVVLQSPVSKSQQRVFTCAFVMLCVSFILGS